MIKEFIRLILFLTVGYSTFPSDVSDRAKELKIPYEIVEEVTAMEGADAWYSFETKKIYIEKEHVPHIYQYSYLMTHETIHMIRYLSKTLTCDVVLEEAIAIYGAVRVGEVLGMPEFVIYEDKTFSQHPEVLKLRSIALTATEKQVVELEIQKTLKLAEKFVKDREQK